MQSCTLYILQQTGTTYWLVKDLGAAGVSGDAPRIVESNVQQAKKASYQMAGCSEFAVRSQDLHLRCSC